LDHGVPFATVMMKHGEERDNVSPLPVPRAGGHRRPTDRDRRDLAAGSAPAPGAYLELVPPVHLRDHVLCFWYRAPGNRLSVSPVFPDGCIDVIWRTDAPPAVAGPMTEPLCSRLLPGVGVAGIRFRPGAASHILGVSARDLRDRHVPLRDIWSQREFAPWETVSIDGPLSDTVAAMAGTVSRRVMQASPLDPFLIQATRWMADHPFGPIDALCQLSGLSSRQVRRRFDQTIGYGPKTLQRVLRLQFLLWLAAQRGATERSLAALAVTSGYADQPHMTREVVALTGASPRQILVASTPHSAVSGLFLAQASNLTVQEHDHELA
jgi:AraC-like DNA-binding protein